MPENGYFGKEIIAMAEEIYSEHQDTYLDKDIEFYKEFGTQNDWSNCFRFKRIWH